MAKKDRPTECDEFPALRFIPRPDTARGPGGPSLVAIHWEQASQREIAVGVMATLLLQIKLPAIQAFEADYAAGAQDQLPRFNGVVQSVWPDCNRCLSELTGVDVPEEELPDITAAAYQWINQPAHDGIRMAAGCSSWRALERTEVLLQPLADVADNRRQLRGVYEGMIRSQFPGLKPTKESPESLIGKRLQSMGALLQRQLRLRVPEIGPLTETQLDEACLAVFLEDLPEMGPRVSSDGNLKRYRSILGDLLDLQGATKRLRAYFAVGTPGEKQQALSDDLEALDAGPLAHLIARSVKAELDHLLVSAQGVEHRFVQLFLRQARDGLTQEALAKECGISRSTLRAWLAGGKRIILALHSRDGLEAFSDRKKADLLSAFFDLESVDRLAEVLGKPAGYVERKIARAARAFLEELGSEQER